MGFDIIYVFKLVVSIVKSKLTIFLFSKKWLHKYDVIMIYFTITKSFYLDIILSFYILNIIPTIQLWVTKYNEGKED